MCWLLQRKPEPAAGLQQAGSMGLGKKWSTARVYFSGTFLPFWGSAGDPSCCCSVLGHGDRLFCFLGSFYKLVPFLSDQRRYTWGGTVPETCTDQQDWSSGGARSPSEF